MKHDIEQLQSDAKALRGQAEERRIAARRAADEAMARARVDAGAQADALISVAQTRAAELVAEAQAEVVREVESARREEPRIVNALADEMLGRALGGLA